MYALTAEQTDMVTGADAGDAGAGGAIAVGLAGARYGATDGAIGGIGGGPLGIAVGFIGGAIVGFAVGFGAYELATKVF